MDLSLVWRLRASSHLFLILWRGAAMHLVGYCKTISVLKYLSFMTERLLMLTLIVANDNHPWVACVCSAVLDVAGFLTSVYRASFFVNKLARILVLICSLVWFRRDSNVSWYWCLLIDHISFVRNHYQIPIVRAVWWTARFKHNLAIIIRITEFAYNLIVLAVWTTLTTWSGFCHLLWFCILFDKARVLSVGVLFNESRMWFVAIITNRHIIHYLRRSILVLDASSSNLTAVCEWLLSIEMQIIVLHHAIVVPMLTICCWLWAACSSLSKAWLATGQDIAYAFTTSLILGIASLSRWITGPIIPKIINVLDLDILQAFVWTCLQTVIAGGIWRLKIDLTLVRRMIRTWAKAENASFWALNVPKFCILSDLTLSLLKLILWNSLTLNWRWVSFYLANESLVIDFNRQNFRILIWIKRMLALDLLFRWSRILSFVVLSHIQLITWRYLAVFRGVTLPSEYSLLLRRTSTPFDRNNDLISLCIFLIDSIIPVHFNNLTYLNRRVSSYLCLEIVLLVKIIMGSMVVCPSE